MGKWGNHDEERGGRGAGVYDGAGTRSAAVGRAAIFKSAGYPTKPNLRNAYLWLLYANKSSILRHNYLSKSRSMFRHFGLLLINY